MRCSPWWYGKTERPQLLRLLRGPKDVLHVRVEASVLQLLPHPCQKHLLHRVVLRRRSVVAMRHAAKLLDLDPTSGFQIPVIHSETEVPGRRTPPLPAALGLVARDRFHVIGECAMDRIQNQSPKTVGHDRECCPANEGSFFLVRGITLLDSGLGAGSWAALSSPWYQSTLLLRPPVTRCPVSYRISSSITLCPRGVLSLLAHNGAAIDHLMVWYTLCFWRSDV